MLREEGGSQEFLGAKIIRSRLLDEPEIFRESGDTTISAELLSDGTLIRLKSPIQTLGMIDASCSGYYFRNSQTHHVNGIVISQVPLADTEISAVRALIQDALIQFGVDDSSDSEDYVTPPVREALIEYFLELDREALRSIVEQNP